MKFVMVVMGDAPTTAEIVKAGDQLFANPPTGDKVTG